MAATGGEEWARLARFGPFFVVDPLAADARWRPIADLGRPEILRRRADAVAAALGTGRPEGQVVPERVAASVSQLGLSARLSAVALAAFADGLAVPSPAGWSYVDRLGGPFPVAVSPTGADPPPLPWPESLLALVGPVAATTIATFSLSPQVVWGNAASGLAGAARMIIAAEPVRTAVVEALLADAFDSDELRATMTTDGAVGHRRRSCCLIYRLYDEPMFCVDCVLAPRTTT